MKLKSLLGLTAAITIVASLAFAVGVRNNASEKQLPKTGWVAGFHAYHGPGHDTVPVQVFSVTSDINEGLVGVQVKNRSDKAVREVRLAWYVSEASGAGAVLAKGETANLKLTLSSQEKLGISIPNLSWDAVLRPVMRKGSLRGDYDVWVVVSRVVYDNGSVWRFSQPTNVARITGKKNAHFSPEEGCANQTCKKNGDVYQCVDGTGELCTNQGARCTSSICGAMEMQ
jgi:hypothetical protein